ncbi:MAG: amidohydrolase [Chloroflexi bacterium]|nr:amidohydrolase [Chloroflexota bacterium]
MPRATLSHSAKIRAKLNHPVVDSDGHLFELMPVFLDYLKDVGGGDMVKRYTGRAEMRRFASLSFAERMDEGAALYPWWVIPTRNTLDRATASLPKLLNARMDEMGLDFCVLYPTIGTDFHEIRDAEVRQAACRALNRYLADLYGPYSYRMTPAAAIPMHTPQEAIAEMEFVTKKLKLKAAMIGGWVRRPIPKPHRENSKLDGYADDVDTFGVDSPYDYDPVWAKSIELGLAFGAHGGGMGIGFRRSRWNYMFNHIGHFAEGGQAFCKSLFFSGVTRRFPKFKVALLECGVGWGSDVYAGIVSRWKKRNAKAVHNMDPAMLDRERYVDLLARYAEGRIADRLEDISASITRGQTPPDGNPDDWSRCNVRRAEDIRDLFIPHFYFGCEADDAMNSIAFNTKVNPFGARLNAMLSSDIGHWDVPDMREVLAEAWELVEDDHITERDFRDFVFGNPVGLYGSLNPDFFKGTIVEKAAAKQLASSRR